MKGIARWTFLLALSAWPAIAATQAYETWLGGFFSGPLHGRLLFQGDIHYRSYADFSPHWVLVRPALGFQLQPGMSVSLGYAWTPNWPKVDLDFEERVDEHRVFEQWQYEFPLLNGRLTATLRARLEQRVRPSVSEDVGHRLRQFVKANVPLSTHWQLISWDEFFVAFNSTGFGQRLGIDQNRFFLGAGFVAVPKRLRLEAGYFQQYLPNAGKDTFNHASMMNTYITW